MKLKILEENDVFYLVSEDQKIHSPFDTIEHLFELIQIQQTTKEARLDLLIYLKNNVVLRQRLYGLMRDPKILANQFTPQEFYKFLEEKKEIIRLEIETEKSEVKT